MQMNNMGDIVWEMNNTRQNIGKIGENVYFKDNII